MKKLLNIILFVLLTNLVYAQTKVVRGVVVDDTGTPLISTTITEQENPKNIVITDANGNFNIKVGDRSTSLIVSSVGYVKKVITITSQPLKITLKEDNSNLNEVVVVGFTAQKKITNAGATSTVSGKELRQSPAASFQNALAGRLPGLFQQQTSGQPGADAANIYIRGISTYTGASNRPLVIVDDVEYPYEQLSQLSSNEIESVSLLKDASSTAIYGIKGANGVIAITTRRGTVSEPKITFRSDFGMQMPTIRRKPLGAYDALTLLKEQEVNEGRDPNLTYPGLVTEEALNHFKLGDDPYRYPSVKWYDEVMRKSALQQSNNVDIVGGTQNLKYFVALGSVFQNGILKEIAKEENFNSNYYLKRYNIRSNIDLNVTKTLTLKLDLSARFNEVNQPNLPDVLAGGAISFWRRLSSGLLTPWNYPVKNADGSYGGRKSATLNPVGILQYAGYNRDYSNNLNANIKANQNLDFVTKGLAARVILAYTNNVEFGRSLTRGRFPTFAYLTGSDVLDPVFPELSRIEPLTLATTYGVPFRKINTQGIIDYNRQLGNHNLYGLVVYNQLTDISGATVPANFRGYSLRAGYNYKSKYIIELNGAYNGTDRFKASKRNGLFPAVSAAWNISEEPFFKKAIPFINYWKIRGSLGTVGSDDFPSAYRYIYEEIYNAPATAANSYWFGDNNTLQYGITPGALANSDVKWEQERKLDIGTDIKLLNSKLGITFDYFDHRRYDILTVRETVPNFSGITLPPVNLGIVNNKGFELDLSYQDNFSKNFSYFFKGNISLYKNKIIERDEPYNQGNPLLMRTGRPIGQIYGYTNIGYYNDANDIANSPTSVGRSVKPGDLKYADINNDGKIDQGDIGPIGNPNIPQINYGFSLGANYKGFDISLLFQGAAKGSLSASTMFQIGNVNGIPSEIHLKRWTPETKDIAELPRLGGPNFDMSTFWLRPTDYIRLKNIELGYNFNNKLVNKIGLKNARIYTNAANLVTWFKLKIYDIDPESINSTGTVEAYSSYPQQKIVNFGLQVTF
ncbi:TonB-dependent receptor [Pedobacter frigiditerrae]|uniref:SusC/RagA family TonB-linked outer membrane protein n=1 Tax=Pedobacter frigiditerrae TaxID=2530452 RepID=UPI0029318ED1|nr:TonB-dependent receptor [Pedobacter frigiditerrae]